MKVAPADQARLERQAAFVARARDRDRRAREGRLLRIEGSEGAVRRALKAYADVPPVRQVLIRHAFIGRAEAAPARDPDAPRAANRKEARAATFELRPPLGKLLSIPSNALPTYLSMLFVTQADLLTQGVVTPRHNATKDAGGPEAWATLCGRWAPAERTRRARLQRDLEVLANHEFVELFGTVDRRRFEGFQLLNDDPGTRVYRPPQKDERAVGLPSAFFRQGWHLVLTSAEIGALLTILHADAITPHVPGVEGIAIPVTRREALYRLSSETYDAVHELHAFGLIRLIDPMPSRRNGKVRILAKEEEGRDADDSERLQPYRFVPARSSAYDKDALSTVVNALHSIPFFG